MSFKCQQCNKAQPPHTTTIRVVAQRRQVTYKSRANDKGEVIDPGGEGWEIVKELVICAECKEAVDKIEETKRIAQALKLKHNVRQ